MNWYFAYLIFAMLVGVLVGMIICWHAGDRNHAVGELIIGEPDSEEEEYVVLKVNKLDLTRK